MKVQHTAAGLAFVDITDADGKIFTVQESSCPEAPHLHIGRITAECGHLTKKMVCDLLPYLISFAGTGEIE